ncbi:MAG: sugar phosphate isomerase/epimerase [Tannerella sp.]|jgi:sugar phosphate isomerase/epimerase|nr:sugar phosphate isomerase/epimerase [Tannerella sp.]
MTNRREFLRNASILTVGGLLAGRTGHAASANFPAAAAMPAAQKKNIGLQTYSLGNELWENTPEVLKKLASYGYTHVELAGYDGKGNFGPVKMADFKKMADDAGLRITSSHINPPFRVYTPDILPKLKDYWKTVCEQHAAIGCKYVVQPSLPEILSVEEGQTVGSYFTEAGKIAKAAGLQWGYHSHNVEFAKVVPGGKEAYSGYGWHRLPEGAKYIYDVLMAATDPAYVIFELDCYWAVMGMQDPCALMREYPTRIRLLHIKDKAVLGESGMMNFEMIFKQAYAIGIKDWFVELEGIKTRPTQLEGCKACAEYLLKAPFVK